MAEITGLTRNQIKYRRNKFNIESPKYYYGGNLVKLAEYVKNNYGGKLEFTYEPEYKGMYHKYKIHCNVCDNEIEKWGMDLQQGTSGCPICSKNKKFTIEDLENSLKERIDGEDYEILDKYWKDNRGTTVLVKHKICGRETEMNIYDVVHRNRTCPCISSSKKELLIEKLLERNKIKYDKQVYYEDCRNIHKLPFDFKIYKNDNEYFLLEVDGLQHFRPIKYFGGEEKFIKRQKNDEIKTNYCKKNNIELQRIPYWIFDNQNEEYIENLLLKFLDNDSSGDNPARDNQQSTQPRNS